VVRGLCQQHGTLHYFHIHSSAGQAVVTYSNPDEAATAQRSLDSYLLAGLTLSVDFIPDTPDVTAQLSSSAPTDLAASLSSIWSSLPCNDTSSSTQQQQQSLWHSAASVWAASSGNL